MAPVSEATLMSLRFSVEEARRAYATAAPRERASLKMALDMARAALEDAERLNQP